MTFSKDYNCNKYIFLAIIAVRIHIELDIMFNSVRYKHLSNLIMLYIKENCNA